MEANLVRKLSGDTTIGELVGTAGLGSYASCYERTFPRIPFLIADTI